MNHFWANIHGWSDGIPEVYSDILNRFSDGAHFVEVGSWKGRSSAFMAVELVNRQKKIQFDCVDTWEGDPNEQAHVEDEHVQSSTLYDHFLENMKPVAGHFNPIKMTSVEAAKLYPDQSLDFVFIDAAHDYDNVKADVMAWLPKIKPGGVLAGHDWGHAPVARAVKEVLGESNIDVSHGCWIKK